MDVNADIDPRRIISQGNINLHKSKIPFTFSLVETDKDDLFPFPILIEHGLMNFRVDYSENPY